MTHPIFPRAIQACTALLTLSVTSIACAETPGKATVTGKFIGNGKNAEIQFVVAEEREPFNDKNAIELIFTEKDPAKVKKPSWDASFGKLGSALVLSVFHDGGVFGCQVSHSAHSKRGFSSVGQIKVEDLKIANGTVSGHVVTGKELDAFGEKWEVDLTFSAPIAASVKTPGNEPKPVAKESKMPAKEPKVAEGPALSARKLPLPKSATDVEFKAIVNQIVFSSPQSVEAVSKEFAASLKEQGWKDGPGSLMGKKNAILKRQQGASKLTIMVQPAGAGSTVKIFTEGMDWSGGDGAASPAKKDKSASDVDAEVGKALKDAQKTLQDALKDVPKL